LEMMASLAASGTGVCMEVQGILSAKVVDKVCSRA
jgi:hypothetical protein